MARIFWHATAWYEFSKNGKAVCIQHVVKAACKRVGVAAFLLCVSHDGVYMMQVNDALKEEMKDIHALSIKKAITPAQQQAQQAPQ
eukprot:352476-Chlamydomonas_euryale.AAC.20